MVRLCPEQLPARKKFFKPVFLSGVLPEIVICNVLSNDLDRFMSYKYTAIKQNYQTFNPLFFIFLTC